MRVYGMAASSPLQEKSISTRALSRALELHPGTIGRYRAEGKIPYLRINSRCYRYRRSEVEAALAKGREGK